MSAKIIPFPARCGRTAEDAWNAYALHRAREVDRPALADDPEHVALAERLHAEWEAIWKIENKRKGEA